MARSLALVASPPVDPDVARIAAFQRWIEDTAAGRTEPWRFGTALFDDEHPNKWDANLLRVERSLGAATAAELAAEADRLLAHLAHREFVFPDDAEGARLSAGFVEFGYTQDRLVRMILRRDAGPRPPPIATHEVTFDEAARSGRRTEPSRGPRPRDGADEPTTACSASASAPGSSPHGSTVSSPAAASCTYATGSPRSRA